VTEGDRIDALRLRAAAADEREAPRLRLEAADRLSNVHDYAAARSMLEGLEGWDARSKARIAGLRGRLECVIGQFALGAPFAETAVSESAKLVAAGDADAREVLIDALSTQAQIRGWTGDPAGGLEAAERGVALADQFGLPGARVRTLHAYMLVTADRPQEAVDELRTSLERIRRDADGPGELAALNILLLAQMAASGAADALATCHELTNRARELHLYENLRGYQTYELFLLDGVGRYRAALELAEDILVAPLFARGAIYGPGYAALACARLGRFEQARAFVATLEPRRDEDPEIARIVDEMLANIELAQGRPALAEQLFERLAAMPQKSASDTFDHRLGAMWARRDLGRDPGAAIGAGGAPHVAGAAPESEGLVELQAGRYEAATAAFDRAAEAWAPFFAWNADRARWAAAESERLAGHSEPAAERLLACEQVAIEREARPQLARVHRSLRLLGVRRGAPRSVSGPDLLTGRERELLDLVAAGLNNVEIGRRLGLGRGTVARLLGSAMSKLGADTRSQAIALVEA
jgi:DNA-binding CsgD family transcriptional regulator